MRSDHLIVYKHGIVQYIFSVQVFSLLKELALHSQTIYKITGKVMPFYNNCYKVIQIKTFRIKCLLFSHFVTIPPSKPLFNLEQGFRKYS
jgi:hypothetical protein